MATYHVQPLTIVCLPGLAIATVGGEVCTARCKQLPCNCHVHPAVSNFPATQWVWPVAQMALPTGRGGLAGLLWPLSSGASDHACVHEPKWAVLELAEVCLNRSACVWYSSNSSMARPCAVQDHTESQVARARGMCFRRPVSEHRWTNMCHMRSETCMLMAQHVDGMHVDVVPHSIPP